MWVSIIKCLSNQHPGTVLDFASRCNLTPSPTCRVPMMINSFFHPSILTYPGVSTPWCPRYSFAWPGRRRTAQHWSWHWRSFTTVYHQQWFAHHVRWRSMILNSLLAWMTYTRGTRRDPSGTPYSMWKFNTQPQPGSGHGIQATRRFTWFPIRLLISSSIKGVKPSKGMVSLLRG